MNNHQTPPAATQPMKGILLAGGSGTRLHPMTLAISKQLLPVYDKPMVYYPLTTLMLSGIRDIMIISTPDDLPLFQRLLGDGSQYGVQFTYRVQPSPDGIPQAFLLAADWLDDSPCALVLGDNLIFADHLSATLQRATWRAEGATVFAYQVKDPERYGVISFDPEGKPCDIIEKPTNPPSNWAITGLYFYDSRVLEFSRCLKPSWRNELEITDLNRLYLQEGTLEVERLGRGCAWLDAGLPESLLEASSFVRTIQARQGLIVGSPAEVAYRMGYISGQQLHDYALKMGKTELGRILSGLALSDSDQGPKQKS
jgi:glucose-1-phosphate thymidylyltransferase